MTEFDIVRRLWLHAAGTLPAHTPLARALLAWARSHHSWLAGDAAPAKPTWAQFRALIAGREPPAEAPLHAIAAAEALGEALALDAKEARLLTLYVASDRRPRLNALIRMLGEHGRDTPALLAEIAGFDEADAARAARRGAAVRLGLVRISDSREGGAAIGLGWSLSRVLDRDVPSDAGLVDLLIGVRQTAALTRDDFIEQAATVDLLSGLIAGAAAEKALGVNILIHGPPGTGKTELARVIAARAGVALYSVGEADADDEEPSRWDRLSALQLAQRLLVARGGAALLFDEFEDLIGDSAPTSGDWFSKREGSKVFVNRLLEANSVPVIWTTNAIGNVDPAYLRRISYIVRTELPSRGAAQRILRRVSADEGVAVDPAVARLLDATPEAATVLRVATRTGRLSGDSGGAALSAASLVNALRGGTPAPVNDDEIDLSLIEADVDIAAFVERLARSGHTDISLLLTGPPGTGKTGFAHHLARALDRPLLVKRASDLLSKWVGETESNIADAFAEARRRDGVLLFDEVDSLLFDRATSSQSWEVTQVNELLTWLDRHPLPFVAATNNLHRLDPAALRRFVFKVELKPLGRDKAARAFQRFFEAAPPAELRDLLDLTVGDFAVVARQLRHLGERSPAAIVARLRAEASHRPERGRIGF